MAILLFVALTVAQCESSLLDLEQAKRLVLASPNIEASVRESGAKPRFEWIDTKPGGWHFDVNSATPCLHGDACSTLLGHFWVTRDGQVEDLDRGQDGVVVSSAKMRRLAAAFRKENCANGTKQ